MKHCEKNARSESGRKTRLSRVATVPCRYAYGLFAHGGQLYAGGAFGRAGTVAANRVARWDGNACAAMGAGIDGTVLDLVEHAGGRVVAGRFYGAGGLLSRGVMRWTGSARSERDTGQSSFPS